MNIKMTTIEQGSMKNKITLKVQSVIEWGIISWQLFNAFTNPQD
jgi:hypothetical protein